jgi:hypothetical protein
VNSQTTLKQDRAQFEVFNQKNERRNFENLLKKLEPPWPSNWMGTRRMMKMECEFTSNIEVGLGPVLSLDLEDLGKKIEISIKAGATLAQLLVWNQKNEDIGI